MELVLAERVALLSWRLHRVTRYETESIALYQEKAQEDLAKQRARPFSDVSGPASPEVVRSNLKSARVDLKLLKRFARTGDDEPLSSLDAANILWEVAEHTDAVAEGEAEAEELLENLSVPGLEEGTSPEEFEGWTAGLLHRAVEQIASSADREGPEAVLEAAMRSAEWKVKKAKQSCGGGRAGSGADGPRATIAGREDPGEGCQVRGPSLERLYKALHELEALQIRRTGGAAPLARLDVDGLEVESSGLPRAESHAPASYEAPTTGLSSVSAGPNGWRVLTNLGRRWSLQAAANRGHVPYSVCRAVRTGDDLSR